MENKIKKKKETWVRKRQGDSKKGQEVCRERKIERLDGSDKAKTRKYPNPLDSKKFHFYFHHFFSIILN